MSRSRLPLDRNYEWNKVVQSLQLFEAFIRCRRTSSGRSHPQFLVKPLVRDAMCNRARNNMFWGFQMFYRQQLNEADTVTSYVQPVPGLKLLLLVLNWPWPHPWRCLTLVFTQWRKELSELFSMCNVLRASHCACSHWLVRAYCVIPHQGCSWHKLEL